MHWQLQSPLLRVESAKDSRLPSSRWWPQVYRSSWHSPIHVLAQPSATSSSCLAFGTLQSRSCIAASESNYSRRFRFPASPKRTCTACDSVSRTRSRATSWSSRLIKWIQWSSRLFVCCSSELLYDLWFDINDAFQASRWIIWCKTTFVTTSELQLIEMIPVES